MPPRVRRNPIKRKTDKEYNAHKSRKAKISVVDTKKNKIAKDSAYEDIILPEKGIKKKVSIGRKEWKKYKLGSYDISKAEFKYDELQQGIIWKSYYGDVYKCSDQKCLAELKIVEQMTKKRHYFVEVEIKGDHTQHTLEYEEKVPKRLKRA